MADPTTINLVMSQPVRGSDVGTWDVPVNGNTGILDNAFGSVTILAPTNINISLTSSQAQNAIIRLTGALTSNVAIILPSIYKFWTIDNQLTNSPSSFAVALQSTSGLIQIGLPPGQQDVFYDGTTVNYRNMGQAGDYKDYASIVMPSWISLSTTPPYINCNGTVFSSATYPILANLLGTTTLPDTRGRARIVLDAGANRVSSGVSNVAGNTLFAGGGDQNAQSHNHGITDPGHAHAFSAIQPGGLVNAVGGNFGSNQASATQSAVTGISVNSALSGASQNMMPVYVGGITMIRAM
jgi:Phage Tail Collar Domain